MQSDSVEAAERQPILIAALQKALAYAHPVSAFELIETHISWVILTGSFAYKIKKPVKLGFLDFSTLEQRRHFCEEELRLNLRYAPGIYLAVVPICGSVNAPAVNGDGPAIEFALKMRQFPQSARLDKQLDAGLLNDKDLCALAETVAGYHDSARIIAYADDRESVLKIAAPMQDNFLPLRKIIDMEVLSRVQQWTAQSLRKLKPHLIRRRKDGCVRECHGDLHLANLVRSKTGIVAFDCIEFSAELRNIDVISDIAFLVMDLFAHARQDLAYAFLNRYLERRGDYAGMRVFGLYFVYHCMIRAKVAAIRSAERGADRGRDKDIVNLKHHLAVAARWIDATPPTLIAMHGYSGSGKTWLSSQLMSEFPAIRLRADIERKRLFNLDETVSSHSAPGTGIYAGHKTAAVYDKLLASARDLLDAGYSVIIDASFLQRAQRLRVIDLANRLRVPFALVVATAATDELERRLRARTLEGSDASEADIEVLKHQLATADSLADKEKSCAVFVATDKTVDAGQVIRNVRRVVS